MAGCPPFGHLDLSRLRIFIVDDETDARELLWRILEECEAEALVAESAEVALALLEKNRPDLLISDIGTPGCDGYELLKQVRALGADSGGRAPVLALTAFPGRRIVHAHYAPASLSICPSQSIHRNW